MFNKKVFKKNLVLDLTVPKKMVSLFEKYDIVSKPSGTKAREVLIDNEELKHILKKTRSVPKRFCRNQSILE